MSLILEAGAQQFPQPEVKAFTPWPYPFSVGSGLPLSGSAQPGCLILNSKLNQTKPQGLVWP